MTDYSAWSLVILQAVSYATKSVTQLVSKEFVADILKGSIQGLVTIDGINKISISEYSKSWCDNLVNKENLDTIYINIFMEQHILINY